jgi:hypothetical protein
MGADELKGVATRLRRTKSECNLLRLWLPHYHADSEWVMRATQRGFSAHVAPGIVLLNDFHQAQKQLPLGSLRGLLFTFLHPKSHLYLPAVVAILWRYCPAGQRLPTLRALGRRFLRMKR